MTDWRAVRIYGCGHQPHMGREWNCDPAWDVQAVYAKPDEELVAPDGSARRFVFWNRHIDRRFHLDYPRTTRESPRVRSRSVTDPDREWQIVQEHRDRYLADSGLSLVSPPEAIVKCLADSFKHDSYFKHKPACLTYGEPTRELSNPIEGLLYLSFCVGCAHALAALADACGFPARTVGCGAHRVAEVLVNGRWHFIENSCRHADSEGLEAFFPASFMEVTLEPWKYRDFLPAKKVAGYTKAPNGQFHFMGGTWKGPSTLRFAASNAHALYPELERWGFKSGDGKHLPILERANGFYWENELRDLQAQANAAWWRKQNCPFPTSEAGPGSDYLYHPFRPGERIRQSVWLGDLAGMTGLEVTLPVAPEPHLNDVPDMGKKLVLRAGDLALSLADLGAWPGSEPDRAGHRRCVATIPVSALKPHSVNWIVLENRSPAILQAPFIPAALEPYITPLGEI